MMYLQPLEGSLAPTSLSSFAGVDEGDDSFYGGASGSLSGDAISRFVPPWYGNTGQNSSQSGMCGQLTSLLQQLMQMLQQMMGGYGGSGSGTCSPYGNEQYFQNATGSSDGDPHLSFNGSKWTSMASQPDLLNSDSIPGGFQISTQVTAPNAKGITWNQSATVSLNNGATTISMSNNGQPSITSYGQSISIADGQTIQLGNGQSVTCNQNGSLTVAASNGYGGQINTTLTAQGQGVNVDVTAQNVDLGGTLVNGQQQPQPGPITGPITSPITGPIAPITSPLPIIDPIGLPTGPGRMYPDE